MRLWRARQCLRYCLTQVAPKRSHCHFRVCPLALLGAASFVAQPRSLHTRMAQDTAKATNDEKAQTVLVRNGDSNVSWMSKDRLLKEHSGAYTTARTVDQNAIFEFSMHCHRLSQTQLSILKRELSQSTANCNVKREALAFLEDESRGAAKLKPLLAHEINTALKNFEAGSSGNEYQVTVLLTCDTVGCHTPRGRGFDTFTFVKPMPPISGMVDVQARMAKRNNPTIKDVQWVNDRQHLEKLQQEAGVNEIVMYDENGCVTEGLQTNFFAVSSDGTVFTAPDELVLAGTVRKVVIEVAKKHGLPLKFESPSIKDATSWESCFICSTSRLVKPISDFHMPETDTRRLFPVSGTVAHRLEDLVCQAVRENSEPLAVSNL